MMPRSKGRKACRALQRSNPASFNPYIPEGGGIMNMNFKYVRIQGKELARNTMHGKGALRREADHRGSAAIVVTRR